MKKRALLALALAAIMLTMLAACTAETPVETPAEPPTQEETPTAEPSEPEPSEPEPARPTVDREGNPISLPESIETIISLGPAQTEIIVALGFGDYIIAADMFSFDVEGIDPAIAYLDMMAPDGEQILNLQPDVIFITGMSRGGTDDDPLALVASAGICVIYIPMSESLAEIMEDIRFTAAVLQAEDKGEEIVANMEQVINELRATGATITERKTVYFEISPAPWMYSFGSGVFLNEMLEIVGAVNIFADQDGWLAVADEAVLVANPDVILTSVDFIENPIDEILSRSGWEGITAVSEGAVFFIDANASSRPSHNVIIALQQMAAAIYP